jgi:hypothetical protein
MIENPYSPDIYAGTGAVDTYDFTWPILSKGYLIAETKVVSTGAVTLLVLDVDYTIDDVYVGDLTLDGTNPGSLVLDVVLPIGTNLYLTRQTALTQLTDIVEGGVFPAAAVMEMADKLTMIAQEHNYLIRQALKFASTSSFLDIDVPDPENSLLLQWASSILANSTGLSIILEDLPTSDPGITGQLWNDAGTLKVSL